MVEVVDEQKEVLPIIKGQAANGCKIKRANNFAGLKLVSRD